LTIQSRRYFLPFYGRAVKIYAWEENSMSKQTKTKFIPEDVIEENLKDDNKTVAIDFIAWLRANKMSPNHSSGYSWGVTLKGERILFIRIGDDGAGTWRINPIYGFVGDIYECTELKEMNLNYINYCQKCIHMCNFGNGRYKAIGVCNVSFLNPNADTIEIVKSLIIKRKEN